MLHIYIYIYTYIYIYLPVLYFTFRHVYKKIYYMGLILVDLLEELSKPLSITFGMAMER